MLVVFDLDDTLYKECDYVASGRRAVASAIANETGRRADELLDIMNNAPDAFDALSAAIGIPVERMVHIYRYHTPEISLEPGAREVLLELKRRGHTIAIITDGQSSRQLAKIKALGLDKILDRRHIIISDDLGADKNTPIPFAAAEALAPGQRRFYVGDNIRKDFHWPNLRGWTTVMLRDTRNINIHKSPLEAVAPKFRPRITIENIGNIIRLI